MQRISNRLPIEILQNEIDLHTSAVTFTKRKRPLKLWITVGIIKRFQKKKPNATSSKKKS